MGRQAEERIQFLLAEKFPGYSDFMQTMLEMASDDQGQYSDESLAVILKGHKWNLTGATAPIPKKSDNRVGYLAKRLHHFRIWIAEAQAYKAHLYNMIDVEFDALYRAEVVRLLVEEDRAAEQEDRYRFFNEPEAAARFAYWVRMPVWTENECVALSLGKDPDIVSEKSLRKLRSQSPFVANYISRLELLKRSVSVGIVSTPITPSHFLSWAVSQELSIPTEFTELMGGKIVGSKDLEGQILNLKRQLNEASAMISELQLQVDKLIATTDDMRPKSRTTLYKIVLGMAKKSYSRNTSKIDYTRIVAALDAFPELSVKYDAVKACIEEAQATLDVQP